MEQHKYNLRAQQEEASFDNFWTSLRDLAKLCNFCGKCKDLLLRDRIVVGLHDGDVIWTTSDRDSDC